jgi:hypothetical protein
MNKKAACDTSLNILSVVKQRGQIHGSHCDSDETRISCSNSEMKKQSIVWKHSGSPKPKKFKQTFHGKKANGYYFCTRRGILPVAFMNPRATIT